MECDEVAVMTCIHVMEGAKPEIIQLDEIHQAIICSDCNAQARIDGPTPDMFLTCKDCLMKQLENDLDRRK